MCGRTCLTLQPEDIAKCCRYKQCLMPSADKTSTNENTELSKSGEYIVEPEWRAEFNCGRKYLPSFNLAPTDITPVLVSARHFCDADVGNSRLIVPMMWSMIPFWHKGDYRKHGLTTNNCRLEHMLESKLYRGPFRKGQRCVVVCEGFYEWQTTKTAKPSERDVNFLYMPQDMDIKLHDPSTWNDNVSNINLLKMAALFDAWEDEQGDRIYSYSIITFESSKIMSWLHYRMPAILETEEQVNNWLNFKEVTDEQALACLRPATQLHWHQVSNLVNNSRNKSEMCNKPLDEVNAKKAPMNKIMSAWLNVRKRKEESLSAAAASDDEDDAVQTYDSINQNYILSTTSDSESDAPPCAKKIKFSEFKKAIRNSSTEQIAGSNANKDEKE